MNASRLVIEGSAVATIAGDEYESGYVAIGGSRISVVGKCSAPEEYRDALRVEGRGVEIGSLEPGKLANIVHAGIEDPAAALAFGPAPRVALLLVGGQPVVQCGEVRTADEREIASEIAVASRRLAERTKEIAL